MSLTGALADLGGPISGFFATRLPNVEGVGRRWRRAGPPSVRPSPTVLADVVGAAFDYRLRFYFPAPPTRELLAARGADSLRRIEGGEAAAEAFYALAAELDSFIEALPTLTTPLEPNAERWLAQVCFALALFEAHFRDGRSGSRLCEPAATSSASLRSLAPDDAVDDLVALSRVFAATQSALFASKCRPNPTFVGSGDVGGADGDIVIDSTLIEIKTTLRRTPEPAWIYQLAGYALLDYEDALGLEEVAFYLARVPAMLTWPLDQFLSELAGTLVDVSRLRDDFRGVVTDTRVRCA